MTAWLGAIALVAAGLAWLEYRRPNRANLVSRIIAVLVSVAAIIVLLNTRGGSGRVTLLTPGAPMAAHSREAIALEQVQSLASLAARQPVIHLAGWGLLPHEWPDQTPDVAGFERAELPNGFTQVDAPAETGVGERMVVRGTATIPKRDSGWVILEDPAAARDSIRVTGTNGEFVLRDRPRAPGAVSYRLRIRTGEASEVAETIGVAVKPVVLPSVLILDASPSFETGYLKRWLGQWGARVTIRTAISRGKYRIERLNDAGGNVEGLTDGMLSRYQAVLADGGSIAALSSAERSVLETQIRERGLGLLITADGPALVARKICGLMNGFALDPIASSLAPGVGDKGDRRVARPTLRDGPRQSRTGIEAEAASIRPAGIEPIVNDEVGRMTAGWRRAGAGRVGLTLLRAPSRWILEGEPDLFAAYWHAMLRAVSRDTTTRVVLGADGPMRADHPVFLTLETVGGPQETRNATERPWEREARPGARESLRAERGTPISVVISPAGGADTIPLAQDPFDPARWSGRYWPKSAGWHRLELGGGRVIPFRVSNGSEWIALEASARLAATTPRVARMNQRSTTRDLARLWLGPLAFASLLVALSWLWIESRLGTRGL